MLKIMLAYGADPYIQRTVHTYLIAKPNWRAIVTGHRHGIDIFAQSLYYEYESIGAVLINAAESNWRFAALLYIFDNRAFRTESMDKIGQPIFTL